MSGPWSNLRLGTDRLRLLIISSKNQLTHIVNRNVKATTGLHTFQLYIRSTGQHIMYLILMIIES